jgi:hypothetical protein
MESTLVSPWPSFSKRAVVASESGPRTTGSTTLVSFEYKFFNGKNSSVAGLMQSCNGSGTCNDGVSQNGNVQTPCPDSEITQMIQDGVDGADGGSCAGLVQDLQKAGTSDVSQYYIAARLYNSGSVDSSNLDDGLGSTPCYASDVANRLTGWVNAASCCDASTGGDSC